MKDLQGKDREVLEELLFGHGGGFRAWRAWRVVPPTLISVYTEREREREMNVIQVWNTYKWFCFKCMT